MNKRYLVFGLICAIFLLGAGAAFWFMKDEQPVTNVAVPQTTEKSKENTAVKVVKEDEVKPVTEEPEVSSELTYYSRYELPLISVYEIRNLPENIKIKVREILESTNGAYYVKYNNDTKLAEMLVKNYAVDDNKYIRHNLQFVQISDDGKILVSEAGYTGESGEISNAVEQKNDVWEFDETTEPNRPLKHIAFTPKGKILYTEIWNYDEDEPIKYEMRNSKGKPLSILKETQNNASDYRREHVFYTDNGKTSLSLSAGYKDASLSHVSFYNSKNPEDSVVIESEFVDGLKTGEKIYNSEFTEIGSVKAEYIGGELSDIKMSERETHDSDTVRD